MVINIGAKQMFTISNINGLNSGPGVAWFVAADGSTVVFGEACEDLRTRLSRHLPNRIPNVPVPSTITDLNWWWDSVIYPGDTDSAAGSVSRGAKLWTVADFFVAEFTSYWNAIQRLAAEGF